MIAIVANTKPAAARMAPLGNWIVKALTRLAENRRLAAERETARFIVNHGGRLTDEVERRIAGDLT